MSTFTIKLLANGQLPSAAGDLYVVPGSTAAIIKTIVLVNTDSQVRTCNLYVKKSGGTARRLAPVNQSLDPGDMLETDREYTLGAGDAIRGDASAASVVDYSIHGVEETP